MRILRAALVVFALVVFPLTSPAATWEVIGPGGGGAQFNPTISPHDPKTVLVRCDMTGAYITHDGGDSWRMFNLRGVVAWFAFDPVDPNTIYTYSIGLFRSTDCGRTWVLVYPAPASVRRITMPDDHAGERMVTRGGRNLRLTALAIHPADSKRLYAGMVEGRSTPTLQVSEDRGATWAKLVDLPSSARRIYIDSAGAVYVIGANAVGIWRDGQWRAGAPAPGTNAFTDASAGFSNGKLVVYAVAPGAVLTSEDAGATWRRSELLPGAQPQMPAVATSLQHPLVAYVSYSVRGGARSVAKTTDTGRTWETRAPTLHDGWLTGRFGAGWGGVFTHIGAAPNDPNICYATNWGVTMRTTDGGKNWDGVYAKRVSGDAWTNTGLNVTTCYGVHFDPFDPRHIFISYTDIGLFASEDGGGSWQSATRTAPGPWTNTTYWMEFDPEVKGRAWAVMTSIHDLPRPKMWRDLDAKSYNGGVTVSDDGGRTWRVASETLPPSAATHIILDPKSPAQSRTLYVTAMGRGVLKSTDGGKTWAVKNNGIAGESPLAWRLARTQAGTLYAVIARRSENGSYGNPGDGAIYRSRDGAEHWDRITLPERLNGPNGLAIDPADPDRLYLAAWGRTTPDGAADGGIWLSTNGGGSWQNVLSRDQHVYDVTIDPGDAKTLYACGFEDSAWRSLDRGVNWERIRGYNFKWGHRVVPDPRNPKMIYVTTFGGSVWHGPADGDPQATEDIVTPEIGFSRR